MINDNQHLYSIAIVSIIVSMYIGFMLGHQDETDLCSVHITKLEEEKKAHIETTAELTQCKAKGVGQKVLDCQQVCDKQVESALNTKKSWICND